MADVLFFMHQGWKNIWKQKSIWLFSALPILIQLFNVFVIKPDPKSIWYLLYSAVSIGSIVLWFISTIGVPYLVYCSSVEKTVNVQETLTAVKKFAWRVIGCSCLFLLILSPLIFLILALSINKSTQPSQISDKTVLLFFPLALFTGTWDFTMFEFFANDSGIRKSLKNAWELFIAHFNTLATLGLIMALLSRLYNIFSGILTVLIQSGIDLPALSEINFINPYATFSKNVFFVLVSGFFQIIYVPFSASVFAVAYSKYNGGK